MTTDRLASPTPPTPAGPPRSQRIRNLLMIVAGFVVTLGVVVGGALYFLYERSVGIDRSAPELVTDQFLEAVLVHRDSNRTSLFVCSDWSADEAIAAVNPPKNDVRVDWGITAVNRTDKEAIVDVRLDFSVTLNGRPFSDMQSWTFHLRDQDGWRVCSLTKNGSLNP